jgi:hypothetical protein
VIRVMRLFRELRLMVCSIIQPLGNGKSEKLTAKNGRIWSFMSIEKLKFEI